MLCKGGMANRLAKPKKLVSQLVSDLKNSRHDMDESKATDYLSNVNSYLRTAASHNNYQNSKEVQIKENISI